MNANQGQIEEWNGGSGERWLRYQERLDDALAPFGAAALDAASPGAGERVLDVGCGCGATTLELARRVGADGYVLGADISAPMVERARVRAREQTPSPEFQLADASRLVFDGERFDLLFSRFGVMFFDQPVPAFAHLRSLLRPGGRLVFACWRPLAENEWVTLPLEVARPWLPDTPPADPHAPGPFALSDSDRTRRILTEAGFGYVLVRPFDAGMRIGTGVTALQDAAEYLFQIGPTARQLREQAGPAQAEIRQAILRELTSRHRPEGVVLNAAIWIVTAVA
jgi:SAM-dependent methyltransferase